MPDKDIFDLIKIGKSELKSNEIWVNSFHHQGILHVPNENYGVRILGTAKIDISYGKSSWESIVEVMDCEKDKWMSVQWHPEHDYEVNPYSACILNKFKDIVNKK